jgi:hypothetical protein
MLDGDLEEVLETLRNDVVRGPSAGQTALRRLLSSSPLDSRLTPESRDGRVSNSGSVSVRGVSPARNSYFRNPTEEEFRSPVFLSLEDRGGVGTPAGSYEKTGGDPTFYEDGETRPSDQYEYAAEWGLLIIRFRFVESLIMN